ncbi:MAG TPA: stage V sporulation protein AC [Candidatus Aphodoplasma excrementigallinarum]|uniref:Stage V sporulation protein AC n=1 Tax=Candidatus Aphodoplasma excrementigallinarum TaxID=2840673 RepID=A0A9D1NG91_9FIRM|nr:stage V sporulation protein AC [Candidatus Aphodoplasma excrementigallinarum]
MKNMTQSGYKSLVESKSPDSPLLKDMCFAFLIGGLICMIGQGTSDIYTHFGNLGKEAAASATSITLIFIGALLTGLNLYDKIAKFAGAGTIVPITGFANSIVSPAMEYKSEGYVLGMAAKMFTIAGPVLVFGISISVLSGLVLWIFRIFA